MNKIAKMKKLVKNMVIDDSTVNTVAIPTLEKTSELVSNTLDNYVAVPDLVGLSLESAKEILIQIGLTPITVEQREPNKKYIKCKTNEVVDIEHGKINPVFKGLKKGSIIRLLHVSEEVISKSNSWKYKVLG